jgi:hypothetical protein
MLFFFRRPIFKAIKYFINQVKDRLGGLFGPHSIKKKLNALDVEVS